MKVNISYAVELDNIPLETDKLLGQCEEQLRRLHGDLDAAVGSTPLELIEKIHNIRIKLASLDLRLEDCSRILAGYVDICNKKMAGEFDESPVEETDDKNA
tara:strand:+ start:1090 stop:1392 length:303 start_codon:yes stop_codon:yes gene_type:complete